jgi:deoxyguanosine kinase
MSKNKFLVIEGNIGSGKTSLARIIANKYNRQLLLEEFADNTFLPQFYQNPERFAFPLELSFLAERYGQLKSLLSDPTFKEQQIVSDYLFDKSLIFASITLTKHELDLYKRFFEIILPALPKPDLVIYLDKSIPNLQQNIKKRGRNYETEIPDEYLSKLHTSYQLFFQSTKTPEIRIIDTNNIDFIHNPAHLENLLTKIFDNFLNV